MHGGNETHNLSFGQQFSNFYGLIGPQMIWPHCLDLMERRRKIQEKLTNKSSYFPGWGKFLCDGRLDSEVHLREVRVGLLRLALQLTDN